MITLQLPLVTFPINWAWFTRICGNEIELRKRQPWRKTSTLWISSLPKSESMESESLSQKDLGSEPRCLARKLQVNATAQAMSNIVRSLMNSSLEGKKLCGGSSSDLIGEWEDLGFLRFGVLVSDLGRFLGIESIFEGGLSMRNWNRKIRVENKRKMKTNFPKKPSLYVDA